MPNDRLGGKAGNSASSSSKIIYYDIALLFSISSTFGLLFDTIYYAAIYRSQLVAHSYLNQPRTTAIFIIELQDDLF